MRAIPSAPDRMFSVLILTLNEERHLPQCLASVADCDDVVVLDSGSVDRTTDIARDSGARVFTRPFDDFAGQRNYAQYKISFYHPWVFHLDADEQMTPELFAECRFARATANVDGYFVAPKMIFRGQWLPRCTDYPAFQARFVRAPQFSFVQTGHGQREAPGMRMKHLRENYMHDVSGSSEQEWLRKHQRYARDEAREHLNAAKMEWRDLGSSNALNRRRAIKRLSHQLPFRPQLRFVYQYVLRRGFLDGARAFDYCRLLARYERLVSLELQRARVRANE